jgi:hypothetical protein
MPIEEWLSTHVKPVSDPNKFRCHLLAGWRQRHTKTEAASGSYEGFLLDERGSPEVFDIREVLIARWRPTSPCEAVEAARRRFIAAATARAAATAAHSPAAAAAPVAAAATAAAATPAMCDEKIVPGRSITFSVPRPVPTPHKKAECSSVVVIKKLHYKFLEHDVGVLSLASFAALEKAGAAADLCRNLCGRRELRTGNGDKLTGYMNRFVWCSVEQKWQIHHPTGC